eukprot:m.202445 g.202445  ORF g.202445 m.202445 type:complete len:337 (+) comp15362_c1_seq1:2047-3057(+)
MHTSRQRQYFIKKPKVARAREGGREGGREKDRKCRVCEKLNERASARAGERGSTSRNGAQLSKRARAWSSESFGRVPLAPSPPLPPLRCRNSSRTWSGSPEFGSECSSSDRSRRIRSLLTAASWSMLTEGRVADDAMVLPRDSVESVVPPRLRLTAAPPPPSRTPPARVLPPPARIWASSRCWASSKARCWASSASPDCGGSGNEVSRACLAPCSPAAPSCPYLSREKVWRASVSVSAPPPALFRWLWLSLSRSDASWVGDPPSLWIIVPPEGSSSVLYPSTVLSACWRIESTWSTFSSCTRRCRALSASCCFPSSDDVISRRIFCCSPSSRFRSE